MPCSFTHLSLEEHQRLMRLRDAQIGVDAIVRVLGRHRSTIYRELKRNWWHDTVVPDAEGYWPKSAQMLADGRRRRRFKLLRHPRLQAAVVEGRLSVAHVAEVLGLSPRQVQRLLRTFREDGAPALRHKARGRPSNNRLRDGVCDLSLTFVRESYADFGPTLAAEKLLERHGHKVSRETLRTWMAADRLWLSRRQRRTFH